MTLRLQPPECWVYESTLQHLNLFVTYTLQDLSTSTLQCAFSDSYLPN